MLRTTEFSIFVFISKDMFVILKASSNTRRLYMNYGRENLSKKKKDMTGSKVGKKVGLTVVKAVLICLLVLIVAGGCAGYGIVKGLIDSAPDISNMNVAPTASATYIYDQTGNPIQKLTEPTSNRTLVKIADIPLDLQHAVVAIEDERFYQHNGIDIRGIIRAGLIGVTSGHFSEGASTITQQLLKNNVFTDWVTETNLIEKFKRKFQEQYLAVKLEESMTKEQILEDYLNTINLLLYRPQAGEAALAGGRGGSPVPGAEGQAGRGGGGRLRKRDAAFPVRYGPGSGFLLLRGGAGPAGAAPRRDGGGGHPLRGAGRPLAGAGPGTVVLPGGALRQ